MIARGALEGSVFVGFANLCALASLRELARGTSHAKAQSRKEKPQSKTQVSLRAPLRPPKSFAMLSFAILGDCTDRAEIRDFPPY